MIKELDKNDLDDIQELEDNFSFVLKNISNDLNSNPFSCYVLYFLDDRIVGYLNYYKMYEKIEIANFNVLEDYQNRHIGTSLIKYLIDKYFNQVENITLEVKNDNKKALHLYEKMGFKRVGVRNGYYQGVDAILMERGMR